MSTHPFLDTGGRPVAIAHRGGAAGAPENTLPAFAKAVELGYRYLETDVHATCDGVVVAFHDPDLGRVTDRTGTIRSLSAAEVRAADAAFTWSPDGGTTFPYRGSGVHVPTLRELLERFPDARVNLDAKDDAAVEPLIGVLDECDAWDRVCVGSFSDERLARIRAARGPRACTSMGPREIRRARLTSLVGRVRRGGADCLQIPPKAHGIPLATRGLLRAAHRAGLPVHVWTIDDEPTMRRLLDLGVDGIMTDDVVLLRDVFARRGLALDGGAAPRRR